MEYEKQLQLLGLTEKEARVYAGALSLGSFDVATISQKSNLKRPTCYLVLEELTKRGFMSRVPNVKKVQYRVEPPQVVVRQAEHNVSFANKLLPKLEEIYKKESGMPIVRYYSGQKGVQSVLEETLQSGVSEFHNISATKDLVEMAGEDYIKDYVARRTKKKMKVYNIRTKDREMDGEVFQGTAKYLREVRFTPNTINFENATFIYGNRVAIISSKEGGFAVVIESEEVAKTQRALFEALWRISTPQD